MSKRRKTFLRPWRSQGTDIQIDGGEDFDEIVVSDWLHVETMDTNHVWMCVGPLVLNVTRRRGRLRIRIARDGDEAPCEVVVDGNITGAAAAPESP